MSSTVIAKGTPAFFARTLALASILPRRVVDDAGLIPPNAPQLLQTASS